MAEVEIRQNTTGGAKPEVEGSPANAFSDEYEVLAYLGSGSFSNVLKCRERETGEIFACKQLNKTFKTWDEPREVEAALNMKGHPNVVLLLGIHFDPLNGKVSLMYELMGSDLKVLTRSGKSNEPLQVNLIRSIMLQILTGISHLHANGLMHCDLKPANVLLKMPGHVVKLGDMGNVQRINVFLPRPQYYAATRIYRPPECILTFGYYGPEMDIWAAGCIFYELMERQFIFQGISEMDHMGSIRRTLGPMPLSTVHEYIYLLKRDMQYQGQVSVRYQERIKNLQIMLSDLNKFQFPAVDGAIIDKIQNPDAKSLLLDFFQYDPKLRPTADVAMSHVYFKEQEIEE